LRQVVDFESAFGTYYVVVSQVDGPIGREAISFKLKKDTEEFEKINGGTIFSFPKLTPALVMGGN
jgi:nitrous oxide reductase accessory protein NosL